MPGREEKVKMQIIRQMTICEAKMVCCRKFITRVAFWIADQPEKCVLMRTLQNECNVCKIPKDSLSLIGHTTGSDGASLRSMEGALATFREAVAIFEDNRLSDTQAR